MTLQMEWDLQQIAAVVGGSVVGDAATQITGVASIDEAAEGDLVFAESDRFARAALQSTAAAILTSEKAAPAAASKPLILVEDPRRAFVQVLQAFAPELVAPPGVHSSAFVAASATFGADVHIGANVTVGEGAVLGARVVLFPGVNVGEGCVIGDETVLYPNVVLYPRVRIGSQCILHAGCVIGADGFGYIPIGQSLQKVPHLGTVEIGDQVELGANCCIDRAKTGVTLIGAGTKMDNLVHVAHNVKVGYSCILAAHTGVAGSTTLGNGVILAGQAGVKDHVSLGDGARVTAQAGVIGDVAAGVTVSGFPARPHYDRMREYAATAVLPEYLKRVRALEKRLDALEQRQEV